MTMILGLLSLAGEWWKAALGAVLGALLCFPLATCHGEHIGAQRAAEALQRANNAALQAQQRADAMAANQRLADTLTVNHESEVLRNAIASTPDTAPDAVRVQLGCARLRAAGTSAAALPPVCRSGGGTQAGAAH